MNEAGQAHWDEVYQARTEDSLSWYQAQATRSLALLASCALPLDAAIIDVGGGASPLVKGLLDQGYRHLTVLDISPVALALARMRMGAAAAMIDWRVADVTGADLPAQAFDLWHDRAVFHFLTEPADRAAYRAQVLRTLRPGGYLLIATFAQDGPERCSDLPVQRYSVSALADCFRPGFELVEHAHEVHATPAGAAQPFVYCLMRRTADRHGS